MAGGPTYVIVPSAFDEPQRAQSALQVPLQVRRDEPAAFPLRACIGGISDRPVAVEQSLQQPDCRLRHRRRAGRPMLGTDHTTGGDGEEPVRGGVTATTARVEGRLVAGD